MGFQMKGRNPKEFRVVCRVESPIHRWMTDNVTEERLEQCKQKTINWVLKLVPNTRIRGFHLPEHGIGQSHDFIRSSA